ncbi:biopolymer transporter ExbB [Sinirhodobacter ferrireducens]|uniref:Biopolymer transporter ExbB n=1 Tax=Paenirhodobacter ferrireducens TaxID=1215032 RepID=A0A443LPA1_9RHOB|nr:biopolymer transporter ExbB [Sinirhodobacter ferrireducens]RWR50983.1 biopolymer transporter ExbB [Sinirhodobacter ferrireducens]
MRAPVRRPEPHFSQPVRQVTLMLMALALVGAGGWFAYARIFPVFLANPWLNGLIGTVFVLGILTCFWQVAQLVAAVSWIESFAADRPGRPQLQAPQMLAPLAALLGSRGATRSIATTAGRSILESVATRIEEARDITRYLTNLLIFLGLLGTFYGLATTVPAVVDTIRALAPQPGETATAVFDRLMTGLESQLGGMGTAFSSSLLGLAGSLVVGLLELFVTHGQNRFYRELEEWISSITRLSFAAAEGDGEASAVVEILDHMAEQMDALQTLFVRSEHARGQTETQLAQLTDAFAGLAQNLGTDLSTRAEQSASLAKMAGGQDRLVTALEALTQRAAAAQDSEVDAEMRMRLRSIDLQLLRLLEELSAGRQESMAELRNDFAALTRAILTRPRGQEG